jgi:hypothetical protein
VRYIPDSLPQRSPISLSSRQPTWGSLDLFSAAFPARDHAVRNQEEGTIRQVFVFPSSLDVRVLTASPQSNSEENSLLENHGSSSHPRNPENDASSITSFGNAGEGNAGNKAYGATGQDDVRQREEDEREREERERERLLAIAGQAGK